VVWRARRSNNRRACNTEACDEQCDANLDSDPANCGTCGNSCDDDDACTTDACVDGECVNTNNPVDCVLSEWSEWSACDQECGGGWQTRTRTVVTPASCGGAACDPTFLEAKGCNPDPCDEQCNADLMSDPANCGACGISCADGDICTENSCVDGVCVSQPSDPVDCVVEWPACACGEAGFQLIFPQVVTPASCGGQACPPAERRFCPAWDTSSDENNCGACGRVCQSGTTCVDGMCRSGGGPRR
jgi:hypothetical protein